MSRPRKMTTEQMITVVDSYYLTRADCNEKRLKCNLIAAYAVELGYNAQGYDFARNMEVREHIEQMKCFAEVQAEYQNDESIVSAYKSLDVAGFIRNNKERLSLAKALTELDAYWKRIYEYSEMTSVQNKSLMKDKVDYESFIKAEITAKDKANTDNVELSNLNAKLVVENRYLRKMLKKYLYPAIANEILMKENILKKVSTDVSENAVEDMTELSSPQSLHESVENDLKLLSDEEKLLSKMWGLCDE